MKLTVYAVAVVTALVVLELTTGLRPGHLGGIMLGIVICELLGLTAS